MIIYNLFALTCILVSICFIAHYMYKRLGTRYSVLEAKDGSKIRIESRGLSQEEHDDLVKDLINN